MQMMKTGTLMQTISCLMVLVVLMGVPSALAEVTTPTEHLGRAPGTDFELADWEQVSSYFRTLGEESPNVVTNTIGTTTEGRDFLLSIISSPENLANLDAIKERAAMIADPRGHSEAELRDAVENGKVILLISPQMHSTETAGTEAGMVFAHTLATSNEEPWVTARQNMVIGIFACTNPDGLDHVVHWYREHVGTPYEGARMLELYQKYAGHDNNRDWFMLTQAETRIVTEQLYKVWHPQVYWDMHQQGSSSERLFVPPFRDPLNPNLDPAIIAGIDAIGSRALLDLTKAGYTGVSTGVTYDMWWNGGNRNVPVRHNIIGLLTEAASVDIATPIFLDRRRLMPPGDIASYAPSNRFPAPWPGGWWRLSDINDYQNAFGNSLVSTLSREPQFWLRNALEASQRTIAKVDEGGPQAWIIPSDNRDPDAVKRLVDVLMRGGVELHTTDRAIQADGREYPAGSLVIFRRQPYGSHVKDLFEVQRYPEGAPPYDVAGWTLPLLLGVRRVEVMEDLSAGDVEFKPVESAEVVDEQFAGDERLREWRDAMSVQHSSTWSKLVQRLQSGKPAFLITGGERAGLVVLDDGDLTAAERGEDSDDADAKQFVVINEMPRIGLYAPWSGSMNEGWMRYVLDSNEIPYVRVRNEMLRAGALSDFLDVLVMPSLRSSQLDRGRPEGDVPDQYVGGLAPEGAVAIEEFVRNGGRLITVGASSRWAIDLFRLPLMDVTREGEFSCPGSVLRGIASDDDVLTAGLPSSVALFFSRDSAWREMTDAERSEHDYDDAEMNTLLRYAPTRVLLSGWIRSPEVIAGESAWVHAPHGEGDLHLFAFEPQYRGWSQSTFPLIFRSMLLDAE